jgi:hypothetical protein
MSRAWWVLGPLAVPALMTIPAAVAGDAQVRFEIGQPFSVGGRGYEAGVIAVRSVSAYTPSTAMLEVWVNDECLGMMPAYRSVSADASGQSEALFKRDDDGRLELTGFQLTGPSTGATYRLP